MNSEYLSSLQLTCIPRSAKKVPHCTRHSIAGHPPEKLIYVEGSDGHKFRVGRLQKHAAQGRITKHELGRSIGLTKHTGTWLGCSSRSIVNKMNQLHPISIKLQQFYRLVPTFKSVYT